MPIVIESVSLDGGQGDPRGRLGRPPSLIKRSVVYAKRLVLGFIFNP
jgi:hypothetical protein